MLNNPGAASSAGTERERRPDRVSPTIGGITVSVESESPSRRRTGRDTDALEAVAGSGIMAERPLLLGCSLLLGRRLRFRDARRANLNFARYERVFAITDIHDGPASFLHLSESDLAFVVSDHRLRVHRNRQMFA